MANALVLFDVKSENNVGCYSPHVWKARSSLNFKGIPYRVEWVEFPDIAPRWKAMGIAPNPPPEIFEYTCPTVQMPDGSYVMESRRITAALEALQPLPSLHLDNGYAERAQSAVDILLYHVSVGVMPFIPDLLTPRSRAWYHEERKKVTGGISITEFANKFDWEKARPGLIQVKELLNENDGPYILGKEPSFADFVIVSFWQLFKTLGRHDVLDQMMAFDKSFRAHAEVCDKWFTL
ncbi:hypothetical protein BDY17DRAFT_323640 [Neohortaea acidophila]|uniref:GST N-terminal domain-containing protein n=1 Tax=Neohortaea acidophila TaxID=245834 RepID=A0A6A6PS99_9PEZI|nr:uncharacterized protein BDY17DRAFT_323640 [Neohortaea acidophila]KAF2482862.1 hypothetical protein BDY17DRAFT_323640 [Neohortaea acidophila]